MVIETISVGLSLFGTQTSTSAVLCRFLTTLHNLCLHLEGVIKGRIIRKKTIEERDDAGAGRDERLITSLQSPLTNRLEMQKKFSVLAVADRKF